MRNCFKAGVLAFLLQPAWMSFMAEPAGAVPSGLARQPSQNAPDEKTREAARAIAAARAALAQNQFSRAMASFQKAAMLVPRAPGPYLGLAEVAHQQRDRLLEDQNLRTAEQLAPGAAIVIVARARYLVESGDFQSAIQKLEKASKIDPGSALLQTERGDIYLAALHRPLQAIDAYRAALRIDPGNAAARYALGSALNAVGRSREAGEELDQAAQQNPKNALIWSALGGTLLNLNDGAGAQIAFEKALKLAPNLWGAHIGLGDAFTSQQKFSQAIESYQAAKKLDPKSVLPDIREGDAYQQAGKPENAEKAYRQALLGNPDNAGAKNNLAFALAQRRQKLGEALKLAQAAVAGSPNDAVYRDTLAWVYRARGEREKALGILKTIAASNPNPDFFYHLGIVQLEMNRKNEAETAFRAAIKLTPSYSPAAAALRQMGR